MTDRSHLPSLDGVFSPVAYGRNGVDLLDQTLLPREIVVRHLHTLADVAEAIRVMRVRGAPAIGITAAYGMALAAQSGDPQTVIPEHIMAEAASALRNTRPTAVNLTWAIDRMLSVYRSIATAPRAAVFDALLDEARRIHRQDVAANRRMGALGAALLPENATVLTICNTGALATGGVGTAYGVISTAHARGKLRLVYACETRPRLQGARLTAWELLHDGIPFRLLSDGAAAALMRTQPIAAVLAGADRIARNGDTANKIGTYSLAVLAQKHGIPLYIVAPTSTTDPTTPTGDKIPIEERSADEVLAPLGTRIAPEGADAWNPAFDVTPASLIDAIVTEQAVHRRPFDFAAR
jgi:methylthioribose-1-phosphate isomerase